MYESIRAIDLSHTIGDTIVSNRVELGDNHYELVTWRISSIIPEDDGDVRVYADSTIQENKDGQTIGQRDGKRRLWCEISREKIIALYRELG